MCMGQYELHCFVSTLPDAQERLYDCMIVCSFRIILSRAYRSHTLVLQVIFIRASVFGCRILLLLYPLLYPIFDSLCHVPLRDYPFLLSSCMCAQHSCIASLFFLLLFHYSLSFTHWMTFSRKRVVHCLPCLSGCTLSALLGFLCMFQPSPSFFLCFSISLPFSLPLI